MIQTQLAPGDKLVIYSDGLTEAEDANGEFFDTERLRLCLRDNAKTRCHRAAHGAAGAVDRFTEGGVIRDDITALVLEYLPA